MFACSSVKEQSNIAASFSVPEYKEYTLKINDTLTIKTTPQVSALFNSNNTFKITPDGCISYFADGNYLVKDCAGEITKSQVFPNGNLLLANYAWIDSDRVVFSFHPTYMRHLHDLMIFTYNLKTGKKETSYNFEGSGLIYTTMPDKDSALRGKGRWFFETSFSIYFAPLYNESDSSVIISLTPAYYKRALQEGFTNKDVYKIKVLLKVYPKSANKKAERLHVSYSKVVNECNRTKMYNQNYHHISGICNVANNSLLISSGISNTLVEYSLSDHTKKLRVDDNFMFPTCEGSDTLPKSDNLDLVVYGGIYYDSGNSQYYRQVLLPMNFEDGSKTNFSVFGLIIMDKDFKEIRFTLLPKGYKLTGLTADSKLLLHNFMEEKTEGIHSFITCTLGDFELREGYATVPQEYIFPPVGNDFGAYFNSISREISTFENVVIMPLDNTCQGCVNKVKTFLDLADSIDKSTAVILIFRDATSYYNFNREYPLEHLKGSVFYDYQKIYLDRIALPDKFQLFLKTEEESYQLIQEYIPSTIDELFHFLSPTVKIGPACTSKK